MSSPSQIDSERIIRESNVVAPTQQEIEAKYRQVKKEEDVGGENIIETRMGYIIIVNKLLFWFNILMFFALLAGFAYLGYIVHKFYKDWDNGKPKGHPETVHNEKYYYGYIATLALTGTILLVFFGLLIYQITNRSRYTKSSDAILELSKNLTIQSSINRAARNIKTIGGVQLDAERADLDEDVYNYKNRIQRGVVERLRQGQQPTEPVSPTGTYVNPAYTEPEPTTPSPPEDFNSPLSLSRKYRRKKTPSPKKRKAKKR
jgi:hypothetical protein